MEGNFRFRKIAIYNIIIKNKGATAILFFNNDRVIHSIKTAFAAAIGFAITKSVHFPVDQWLIITILVVMCAQMNIGSMLQKSYMRFLGTLAGSLMAGMTLFLFGANPSATIATVIIAALIFSYIATSPQSYNEVGTLGAVTVAIILLGQEPTLVTALERFFEIAVGILIAAIISHFIIPIRAQRILIHTQAQTVKNIAQYYRAILSAHKDEENVSRLQIMDESISKSLHTQRKLAVEAAREILKSTYKNKYYQQILGYEKEILRCINFMGHAYSMSSEVRHVFFNLQIINEFNETVCIALSRIAEALEKKISNLSVTLPTIQLLKETIYATIKAPESDDIICVDGFLFCANILVTRMQKLIAFVNEMNLPPLKKGD